MMWSRLNQLKVYSNFSLNMLKIRHIGKNLLHCRMMLIFKNDIVCKMLTYFIGILQMAMTIIIYMC